MLKTENLLLTAGDVKIAAAGETPTVTIVADSGVDLTVPQIISWSIMTARRKVSAATAAQRSATAN